MTVFWIWYRHWQRTIISSSEYSQTATGNVTQTSTVVSTAKIFAVQFPLAFLKSIFFHRQSMVAEMEILIGTRSHVENGLWRKKENDRV